MLTIEVSKSVLSLPVMIIIKDLRVDVFKFFTFNSEFQIIIFHLLVIYLLALHLVMFLTSLLWSFLYPRHSKNGGGALSVTPVRACVRPSVRYQNVVSA